MLKQQLAEIKSLQELCEKEAEIQLKLNWDMLKTRREFENSDFFHYDNGKLVAFLAVYKFGNKYEICGMVHPEFRRRGIFTDLLAKAMAAITDEKKILINAPAKSQSAKAWVKTISAELSLSEYRMKWLKSEVKINDQPVHMRKARLSDIEVVSELDVVCFGFEKKEALVFNRIMPFNEADITYIIEVKEETIGKIRIERNENESWIFGFAIFPNYQRKGYGRNVLIQTVINESNRGNDIYLEVELKNKTAMKLYEQAGFVQYETQDYYKYSR